MLFNSLHFIVFFPIVLVIYYGIPGGWRKYFLLIASIYFYLVFIPWFFVILGSMIALDFWFGQRIESSIGRKKSWLTASIISNLLLLAIFKYSGLIVQASNGLLALLGSQFSISLVEILIPLGLSFHTFQTIAYNTEIYRGKISAEKNIIDFALYVLFFPQLVAGPIERPQRMLIQFKTVKEFDFQDFRLGASWMVWGFFKKCVIGDRLGIYTDIVYNNVQYHNGTTLLLATLFFSVQIYCDFSGYTDIARGAARILGYDLSINFNFPYFSLNIREFWQRWHISLSTWFRDYLYIPLGGGRENWSIKYRNLLIVFVISGLWHGASLTFAIWGLCHFIYYIVGEMIPQRISDIFPKVIKMMVVFLAVSLAYVFFRSESLEQSWQVILKLVDFGEYGVPFIPSPKNTFVYYMVNILLLFIIEAKWYSGKVWIKNPRWNPFLYASICLYILLFGIFESERFIYFQF